MAYYLTHGISQFLLNNEKQRVRFLLARPVYSPLSKISTLHVECQENQCSNGKQQSKAKQRCVMGVGMCLYAQLVQTKNKQCKSAIIIQ